MTIPEWNLGAIPKVLEHCDISDAPNTFNMGYGWVAVVSPDQADVALSAGPGARFLGEVGGDRVTVEIVA